LDSPGTAAHKKHKYATPLAGGLALLLVLTSIFIIFGGHFSQDAWKILAATLVVALFGIYDDSRGLDVKGKLFGQLLAAVLLLSLGVQISIVRISIGPITPDVINSVLTIFWLIGVTNAYNLIDSADGLAISLGITSSLFMLVGSIVALQVDLTYQATIIFGVFLVLLFYNLTPARLFLGDGGAQTAGFLLASLGILYSPAGLERLSSWFVPITFFALPIFDTCLVFFSRLKRGLPFYKADLNHTYHRLVRLGLSPARAIWLMDLAAMTIGAMGLFALYQGPIIANLIFAALILSGMLAFLYLERAFEAAPQRKPRIS
jgi:UDP-GlcNAc:undecaprenyl-phosphate GlcNAc-1-phosphate transferase